MCDARHLATTRLDADLRHCVDLQGVLPTGASAQVLPWLTGDLELPAPLPCKRVARLFHRKGAAVCSQMFLLYRMYVKPCRFPFLLDISSSVSVPGFCLRRRLSQTLSPVLAFQK